MTRARLIALSFVIICHHLIMAPTCIEKMIKMSEAYSFFKITSGDFTFFRIFFSGSVAIGNVIWCYAFVKGKLGRQSCERLSVHLRCENLVLGMSLGRSRPCSKYVDYIWLCCHYVVHVFQLKFNLFTSNFWGLCIAESGFSELSQDMVELWAFVCLQLV